MTQGVSEKFWQAEAGTEETKQFIRDSRGKATGQEGRFAYALEQVKD